MTWRVMTAEQKERERQRKKAWAIAHPHYGRDWLRAHPNYERAFQKLQPERAKENGRRWRAAHPDYRRQSDRACSLCGTQIPRRHGAYRYCSGCAPLAKIQHEANRRALKTGSGGKHSIAEWEWAKALTAQLCVYCGQRKPLVRDHVVPLTANGGNTIENIVPACVNCNSSKHDDGLIQFLMRRAA